MGTTVSRRRVLRGLGMTALAGGLRGRLGAMPAGRWPALGLNTWSLRGLNHDEALPVIFSVMKRTGMVNCQLLSSHAEPARFDPGFGGTGGSAQTPERVAEAQRRTAAREEWLASVPMSYFEALRSKFERQGLKISAYIGPLPDTAAGVDRALLIAKSLGASVLNSRVREAQTDMVAAAAQRHGLQVGIQVTDVRVLANQLRASSWLRADPDVGDLTKAGIDALAFVREHADRIAAVDLKDALPGGPSVPFGTGQARLREVIAALRDAGSVAGVYIDCDYPGTGRSGDEVERCVRYVRGVVG